MPHIMLGEFETALRLTRACAERAPKLWTCFRNRAIAANEFGFAEEARAAVRRVLEIDPRFTIEQQMRRFPMRGEADAARYAEYMRRAGLPE